jgi:hypothetical protein
MGNDIVLHLKIALLLICLATCLAVNLLDENIIVRGFTFFGGFMSGWSVCHSMWCMAEQINQKVEK